MGVDDPQTVGVMEVRRFADGARHATVRRGRCPAGLYWMRLARTAHRRDDLVEGHIRVVAPRAADALGLLEPVS